MLGQTEGTFSWSSFIGDFLGEGLDEFDASNELSLSMAEFFPGLALCSSSTSWISSKPLAGEFFRLFHAWLTEFWARFCSMIDSCRWGFGLCQLSAAFFLALFVLSFKTAAFCQALPTISSSWASSINVFWLLICIWRLAFCGLGLGLTLDFSTFYHALPTIYYNWASSIKVF